ncbi:protein Vhl [Atheta coriaria]|uniref:protein Vhl n=1 Tax=Dalotia coriaria TaxID=877792 RepID=UPI0031F354BE
MEDHDEPNQENAELLPLRSRECLERSYVRFVNTTNRTIEIIWLNYTGQRIRYQLIGARSYANIDTFKTHPWIAQDVLTKDRMWLERQYVYQPQTTREHLNNANPNIVYPIPPPEVRKVVAITLPMLTLRYHALLTIRNLFAQPEAVDNLELPRDLKEDLKKVIILRNRRLATSALTVAA